MWMLRGSQGAQMQGSELGKGNQIEKAQQEKVPGQGEEKEYI